ncbi:50S ribosomal protein L22 [Candidatus Peregrinibacteria bacterium]|nr:50S ribosomal protein L22 [Candidatus Peregrinibacteria bacterium]
MQAILRQVRISCRKAALVADLVRNKKVEDAINILRFTPKKAAPIIKKVIAAAAANAENNFKQDKNTLFVKEIICSEGTTYKRGVHISRGRSHPILKKTAHIMVKLESRGTSAKKAVKTAEPKAKTTKSTK